MVRIRLGITLLVPILIFASSPVAVAHAQFNSSYPTKNQTVKMSPENVWIQFNEEILTLDGKVKNYLRVIGPEKQRVEMGSSRIVKAKISVALRKNLKPGRYQVLYRIVSADGHPLKGSFTFNYKP